MFSRITFRICHVVLASICSFACGTTPNSLDSTATTSSADVDRSQTKISGASSIEEIHSTCNASISRMHTFDSDSFKQIAYSPKDRVLYSSSKVLNDAIFQWDISTGELMNEFEIDKKHKVNTFALSPSGRYILVVSHPRKFSGGRNCLSELIDTENKTETIAIPSSACNVDIAFAEKENCISYDIYKQNKEFYDFKGKTRNPCKNLNGATSQANSWRNGQILLEIKPKGLMANGKLVDNRYISDQCVAHGGKYIVAVQEGRIVIWRMRDFQVIFSKEVGSGRNLVACDESGEEIFLVINDDDGSASLNAVHINDEKSERYLTRLETESESCEPSPTGRGGPMCKVPSGEFWFGCNGCVDPGCDIGYDIEHEYDNHLKDIFVNDFLLDKKEVSVADYELCVKANVCDASNLSTLDLEDGETIWGPWACNWAKPNRSNHPINCISWEEAETYCNWVGKRLPTNTEWEKAARGEQLRTHPWGNQGFSVGVIWSNIADNSLADFLIQQGAPGRLLVADFNDGCPTTSSVENYETEFRDVSVYGIVGMGGNVSEWVSTSLAKDYANSKKLVQKEAYRGASILTNSYEARISYVDWSLKTDRLINVGFRCALSEEQNR